MTSIGLVVAVALKVAAVMVVSLLVVRGMRRQAAASRHWVLVAGVGLAWLMPLFTAIPLVPSAAIVPRWDLDTMRVVFRQARAAPVGVEDDHPGPVATPRQLRRPTWRQRSDQPLTGLRNGHRVFPGAGLALLVVWSLGLVTMTSRLGLGLVRMRRVGATARRPAAGAIHRLGADIAKAYGLRRPVTISLGSHPARIMTWGWWRPRVMLPLGANEWSDERIRVVLLHEFAHVHRGDWAVQLVAEGLRCVYWFNPAAWSVCAELRQQSEQACDDLVVTTGVDAMTYATHLVQLVREARQQRRTWLPAPAMASPSSLERRVLGMLKSDTNRQPMSQWSRLCTTGALVATAIVVASLNLAAQTGRIAGTVVDQTGQVVAGPLVRLTHRDSGQQDTATGDAAGAFELTNLDPGEYSLVVSTPGFARAFRRVSVGAGEQVTEAFTLDLGSLEETITVTYTGESASARREISPATRERYRQMRAENRAAGETISPPIKIQDQPPVYPESFRETAVVGKVVLDALITTEGTVDVLQILAPVDPDTMTTVNGDIARAAVEAVDGWRYEPTLLHGDPVDTRMTISVSFLP